jgi:hypothetical protein
MYMVRSKQKHSLRTRALGGTIRLAAGVLLSAASLYLSACAPSAVKAPPPQMDVSDCHACHAGKGAYPLAADVYQYWETSGHGKFLNRPDFRPTCESCHDLAGPAAAGHLDGVKNAPGPNTYHLAQTYIAKSPKNRWDFQVNFDNTCWTACHQPIGINDMRHERDGTPAPGAVQMGQHASYERPISVDDYFVDSDLAVFPGSSTPPFYVTCVTCHNPHGSGATSMTGRTNRMTRENYKDPPRMCSRCHI